MSFTKCLKEATRYIGRKPTEFEENTLFVNWLRLKMGLPIDLGHSLANQKGGSKPKYSAVEATQMHLNGSTYKELMAHFNCSESQVYRLLHTRRK